MPKYLLMRKNISFDNKNRKVKFAQLQDKARSLLPGPLVIGISGGLDSCVLLDLLCQVIDPRKNPLLPCYVEHGIRFEQPEAIALPKYCQSFGLELYSYHIQKGWLHQEATRRCLSLEDLARQERYRRLQHCQRIALQKYHETWSAIVLAHHADDQTENFFMNLGRGSGLKALAGMREWQQSLENLLLWRPLLAWSRQDLQSWAEARQIPHWEDSSNFQQETLRNFYRWQVLPQFKRLVPNLLQSIQRSQKHLALLEDWLQEQCNLLETQLEISTNPENQLQIEWLGDFGSLPKPVKIELIFLLFDQLRHGEQRRRRLPFGFTMELLKLWEKTIKASGIEPIETIAHGCRWQMGHNQITVCAIENGHLET